MSGATENGTLIAEAKRQLREGRPARAIELFRKVLAEHGPSSEVHEGLAAAHFAAGDLPAAAEEFRSVLALQPGDAKALINLGAVYNRMGEYKKAVETLRRGIQKDSRCSQGYYNLGIAERKQGNLKLAVSAYREALRLKPDMADAHQNLANVLLEQENVPQAILHYKKALELNPQFDAARRGLARAENAGKQARAAANPFGRLVGTRAAQEQPATAVARAMTDEERRRDREVLVELAARIQSSAAGCLERLKGQLEPALLALTRSVAGHDATSMQLWQGFSHFRTAAESTLSCRREFRRAMQELRGHEAEMTVPAAETAAVQSH